MINDSWMDQIASLVTDLNADIQRRAGVLEIDECLKVLRKRRYPDRTKISGEEAFEYLQACASEIYALLKHHATSYSQHKWLWYLRRIPDEVFQFKTFSNPEYDRVVTESAAGLYGKVPKVIPLSYQVEKTTVRQVLRFCGMCLHLSDVFGAMQWAGTGLDFEFRARPIPDPIASKEDAEAVSIYTGRLDAEYPMFSRLGVITGLGAPRSSPLLVAPLFRACPPEQLDLQEVKFPHEGSVLARYRPRFVAVDDVLTFLGHPGIEW